MLIIRNLLKKWKYPCSYFVPNTSKIIPKDFLKRLPQLNSEDEKRKNDLVKKIKNVIFPLVLVSRDQRCYIIHEGNSTHTRM